MTGELHVFSDDQTRRTPVAVGEPPCAWQAILPAADRSPGLARRVARDALSSWQLTHLTDTALLLISELVTNAVLHAGTGGMGLELHLEIQGTLLRMEVHDADLRGPEPRVPSALDESGFGLVIVDALADKWGVRETAAGKAVWAELDTQQHGAPESN
jgi:anti-sigma regulatory factor (Ser/Thr protein kinase)